MLLAITLSLFLVLLGSINLLMKPYYHEDKNINMRKVALAQGYMYLIAGLAIYPLYTMTRHYEAGKYLPFIFFVLLITMAILNTRFPKWYNDENIEMKDIDRQKYKKNARRVRKSLIWLIALVMVPVFFMATHMPSIAFENEKLTIDGMYGLEKKLNEIIIIDTIQNLPEGAKLVDGVALLYVKKGLFETAGGEKAKMFVYSEIPPFVYIEYKRANKLYINFKDPRQTRDFYKTMRVNKDNGALP
jgi:uncharacterized membrane protein